MGLVQRNLSHLFIVFVTGGFSYTTIKVGLIYYVTFVGVREIRTY